MATTRRPARAKSGKSARLIVRTFADHVVPAERLEAAPTPILRKSADALSTDEQDTFKIAIRSAIADGIYSILVRIHMDMTHDMHTMPDMPAAGTLRFLPWHRLYLINFEQAMRGFQPTFFVPYWRWMDQTSIPRWMVNFKPTGVTDANGRAIRVTRNPGHAPLPTSQTIQRTVMSVTDYWYFTLALEGFYPYGAHNLVHNWFNGTMTNVPRAPADPMFWMHHAEIDRLWWIWQRSHPGQEPNLRGADAVLDPWPEQVSDVLRIDKGSHPYSYDRAQL
jgi:tyrosinase